MAKIVVFAGSLRRDSVNKKVAHLAAHDVEELGSSAAYLDLANYPIPIYNADDEEANGLPENARKVKKAMIEADGFIIASPEYNSSVTPLLKNTIDWVSRKEGNEKGLVAFEGKVALLLSASPGRLGGLRALAHLRSILSNIGVLVFPTQLAIPNAYNEFNGDDQLKDQELRDRLHATVEKFVTLVNRYTVTAVS